MLAMTATSTKKMQQELSKALGLKDPFFIVGNIDRPNIKFEVKNRPNGRGRLSTTEDAYDFILKPMCQELTDKQNFLPKTIIYSKLKWCGHGQELVNRIGGEEVCQFVAQYHSPCTEQMRVKVLDDMAKKDGQTRLLFATEAYSMGTDAPDIRRIIHAGVPTTLETYVQEIGRAGRDGEQSVATMFFNKSDVSKNVKGMTDIMRKYCDTTECRRTFICEHFGLENSFDLQKHLCCDNCENKCNCDECKRSDTNTDQSAPVSYINKKVTSQLKYILQDYFKSENDDTNVPCAELYTGLGTKLAIDISLNYAKFDDFEVFKDAYPSINTTFLENISSIISAVRNQIEKK